jgi:hypothetical protein
MARSRDATGPRWALSSPRGRKSRCLFKELAACEHLPGSGRRVPARGEHTASLHHDRASLGRLVCPTERGNRSASSAVLGAYVDEEHLVHVVADRGAESDSQLDERAMGELASKYGELNVLAITLHQPEDFA